VPYPIQKCAAAIYTPEGQKEIQGMIQTYKDRTRFLFEGLKKIGLTVYGGQNAPYIWCKTPQSLTSWQFFDQILERLHIICVPGSGFGHHGEGYVRFSAYTDPSQLAEGLLRMKKLF
jgi:LL-diaminopimelate aminotransferase